MSRTGLLQLLALFGALVSHSLLAQLTCPKNITSCICQPWGFRGLILKCSSNGNMNNIDYEVHFYEETVLKIYCQANANPWGNFLNGETLNITNPAENITILNCPLFNVENFPVVRNNSQPNLVSSYLGFLTDLTSLQIYNSNLNNISANFLCRLPKLKKFTITSSNITSLPAGFFNCSKNLLTVSLEPNKFTPQPGILHGFVSIRNLDLSRNNIKNLNSLVFWHLRTLRKLDLSYNDLTEMPNDIFKFLTALKELKLNNNKLTYIPEGLFSSTTKLETLIMANNKLTSIHENAFVTNGKLKLVNFAFNYLNMSTSNISGSFSPLRHNLHLKEIYLNSNLIRKIHSDWHKLPNLRILDLSDNYINNLKFEDLQFKARHVTVDLQGNILKTVNLTTLECLTYSTSNDIPKITVRLRENPFECTCDSFLRYLNRVMTPRVYANVKLDAGNRICLNQRSNCTFRNDTCINN